MRDKIIEAFGTALVVFAAAFITYMAHRINTVERQPPTVSQQLSSAPQQSSPPSPSAPQPPATPSQSTIPPPEPQIDQVLTMVREALLLQSRGQEPPLELSMTADAITLIRGSTMVRLTLSDLHALNIRTRADLQVRIDVIRRVEAACAESAGTPDAQLDCAVSALKKAEMNLAAAFLFAQEDAL